MQDYPKDFKQAAEFHGHICPGLAIGYRVARAAMEALGPRAEDEERVCEVQNDSCAVDAIQFMIGCTFGKGNLVFKDYGKQVYYFWTRDEDKPALRIALKEDKRAQGRDERIKWLIEAPLDQVLDIRYEDRPPPPMARIHESKVCEFCGEKVMATRTREINGKVACIPCCEKLSG